MATVTILRLHAAPQSPIENPCGQECFEVQKASDLDNLVWSVYCNIPSGLGGDPLYSNTLTFLQ